MASANNDPKGRRTQSHSTGSAEEESNRRSESSSPSNEGEKKVKRRGPAQPKRYGQNLMQMTSRFRVPGPQSEIKQTHSEPPRRAKKTTASDVPAAEASSSSHAVALPPQMTAVGDAAGLDPFFPLPQPLSPPDRSLLQFYLTNLPSTCYGTNLQPEFSVVRDFSMPQGIGSDVYLGWMLLSAENVLTEGRPEEKASLIAKRRATNYRKMRHLLQDPRNQTLDSTIATLAVAGSAEVRLGAVSAGLEHLAAVLRLLQQKQGLRTLQRMGGITGMVVSHVLHMTGLPMLFDSHNRLTQALLEWEAALKWLHSWNLNLRKPSLPTEVVNNYLNSMYLSGLTDPVPPSDLPTYWQIRNRCIGPSSSIGRFLNPQIVETSQSAQRCRAASLYTLNSILYNLRHDDSLSLHFLMDLEHTVRNSYDTTSPLGSADDMLSANRHAALVSMIAHCARRHDLWLDSDFKLTLPPLRTWESLEFAELIMWASPLHRERVLEMLYAWLTQDLMKYQRLTQLGAMDMDEVKCDIIRNWMASRESGGLA